MSNFKRLDQHPRVFTNHICIADTVFPSIAAKYWLAYQPRLATATLFLSFSPPKKPHWLFVLLHASIY